MSEITKRLEELILSKKISVNAFEKEIGSGRTTVSKALNSGNISGELLIKIANRYPEVDFNYLIKGDKKYAIDKKSNIVEEYSEEYKIKCSTCKKKSEMIDNLNDALTIYREKLSECENKKEVMYNGSDRLD